MSYVSSHAGSAIYPGSSAPSVVLPGSNPSGVVYPSSPFPGALYPGSSASGGMYPAPMPGVVYPNVSYSFSWACQHVAAPASYYNHHTQHAHHSVPMQHNFYGAPPVPMPSYVAPPAPAYHRSSYTVPYSVGMPYSGYGSPQRQSLSLLGLAGTTAGRLAAAAGTEDIITE